MKRIICIVVVLLGVASFVAMTPCQAQSSIVMSGRSTVVAVTPTVTASSAYSSGNVVGGVMTFRVFRGGSGRSGVLTGLELLDRANQKQAMTVLIFSRLPVGTYTDKTAFSFNSTDANYLIRSVSIATTDYVTCGSYAVADVAAIGKVVMNDESQATGDMPYLYAVMMTTGTPTWGAVSDVTVKVGVIQD